MYKPWFVYAAVVVLLGCLGFMASEDPVDHNGGYCLRVLIHSMDGTLGHRDYENRCTAEDLERARDLLNQEKGG